jgi:hypothetical protein
MMRWWIPLGTLSLCLANSWALAAGSSSAGSAGSAAAQLQRTYPGVQLLTEDECLTRVYGVAFGYGESAEQSADDFVQSHSSVFGVAPGDLVPGNSYNGQYTQPMMYDPQVGDYGFTLVYYTQYRDGLPVYGSDLRLLVRNEDAHPLVLAASSLHDIGDFSAPVGITANVAEAAAHAAAAAEQPGLVDFGPSDLVIWAGVSGQRAAPTVAISFVADNGLLPGGPQIKWRFLADAASGAILHRENLINLLDVTGNVSGMATPGSTSDACATEVSTPMPYALVRRVNGSPIYADVNGDYSLPNAGTSAVTIQSLMTGLYFSVQSLVGATETVQLSVVPPGPGNLLHNAANTDETVRSQVNGYIQAHVVRQFVLTQNPSFPTVSTEMNYPIHVNRSDGYCPGNAWYDGSSINFCLSSGSYADTAYSSVLHHEYGHHVVDKGGSGQGAYGEGMGDVLSMLIADDPVEGYGFFGPCNQGLRTAANTLQYPCIGEIHDCGQLISGCIWSTRSQLYYTHPTDYLAIVSRLAVNSILLHSGDQITPQITIDFLTLDDTDGNLYNGTPHAAEICAGFEAHNMPCPAMRWLTFAYPDGRPSFVDPRGLTRMRFEVLPGVGQPYVGIGTFCYRIGSGAWNCGTMEMVAPNVYDAVFPATPCGTAFQYYVSAISTNNKLVNDPDNAPTAVFTAQSGFGLTGGLTIVCTPPPLAGDMNCDGFVNYADINPFVLALSSATAYQSRYAGCNWINADCNLDGVVNYADINAFVALLSSN